MQIFTQKFLLHRCASTHFCYAGTLKSFFGMACFVKYVVL